MDGARKKARAQAHAKHGHYCSCGKTVYGNGAEWAHRKMHERKGEWRRDFTGAVVNESGHYWMTYSEWRSRQTAAQ